MGNKQVKIRYSVAYSVILRKISDVIKQKHSYEWLLDKICNDALNYLISLYKIDDEKLLKKLEKSTNNHTNFFNTR